MKTEKEIRDHAQKLIKDNNLCGPATVEVNAARALEIKKLLETIKKLPVFEVAEHRRHKLFFVYYISKRHRIRKFIGTGRTIKKADKIITDYCRKMEIDNYQTNYRTKSKEKKNENRKRDKRSRAKADKR